MKKEKIKQNAASGDKSGVSELKPPPSFIQERLQLWDKLKAQYEADLAAKTPAPINVTLPDGKVVEATAWKTTVYDVAKGIRYRTEITFSFLSIKNNPFSQGLADNSVISKVNGVLWDLDRPLESDCKVELLKFDDTEAQAVFWHSTAHVLGEALERIYGGCLCYGPPIESGFYYDMWLDEKGVSEIL